MLGNTMKFDRAQIIPARKRRPGHNSVAFTPSEMLVVAAKRIPDFVISVLAKSAVSTRKTRVPRAVGAE